MNGDTLAEVIRATPLAWFVFDASERLIFENLRATELGDLPTTPGAGTDAGAGGTVREVVADTMRRARRGDGSAVSRADIADGELTRSLTVEAQQLVLDSGLATVAWAVEQDGRGDAGDVALALDQATQAMEEAKSLLDDVLDDAERSTHERDRLVGVLDAVVSGLDAGLVVVDRSLVVTDCSERAAGLLGVSQSDVVGRGLPAIGGVTGRDLAALMSSCFDTQPTRGLLTRHDRTITAGCASFDSGAAAVAVLQEIERSNGSG